MPGPTRSGSLLATQAIRYVALIIFVVALYVSVAVVGAWVAGFDQPPIGLMLAATTLVAITIGPVSRWITKHANRVVYGTHITPREAVLRLSTSIGNQQAPNEILGSMAEAIRAFTSAEGVVVWVIIEDKPVQIAAAPSDYRRDPVTTDEGLHAGEGRGVVVAIRRGPESLGGITLATDGLLMHEIKMVEDLATSASVVTQTIQLQESIHRRIDHTRSRQKELVAARARTAKAQLDERRRLERNLHDTCQQRAVVLAGKLGLVQTIIAASPAGIPPLLAEIESDIERLGTNLTGIAGGGALPELIDRGIRAALDVETADLGIEVNVVDELQRRHRSELEEAVFACCMEAIQNAVKHAAASRIEVELHDDHRVLRFVVRDDGLGFNTALRGPGTGLDNLHERMGALGGKLTVRSSEHGTEVAGEAPL